MKIKKETLIVIASLMFLYMLLEYIGLIQHAVKMVAFYFQFLKNDYLIILSLALCTSIVLLPASLYLYSLQKSIKKMTESFRIIQQEHENCCRPHEQYYCEKYFLDLQNLRRNYKNVNQTIAIGAILYQVAVFGFFISIVNHIQFDDHSFMIIGSIPYIKWLLLFILMIILATQFRTYLIKMLKKQRNMQKILSLAFFMISISWLTTFRPSEIIFLIALLLIQLTGSILLNKWSHFYSKGKSSLVH
ncbi:hypothetical protein BSM4216_1198 [Bacillus smithii]|nr:hypothetical protein BSM4216_1198 [Bacillus smithii]